jgi:hypothetical protein
MLISRNNSDFLLSPVDSLFLALRQVALPAKKFVDERPGPLISCVCSCLPPKETLIQFVAQMVVQTFVPFLH